MTFNMIREKEEYVCGEEKTEDETNECANVDQDVLRIYSIHFFHSINLWYM